MNNVALSMLIPGHVTFYHTVNVFICSCATKLLPWGERDDIRPCVNPPKVRERAAREVRQKH